MKLSTIYLTGALRICPFFYSSYRKNIISPNAPPAFIACAIDDILAASANSTNLYNAWIASKNSAELHIYSKGGHGLRGSAPASNWIQRFTEWIDVQMLQKSKK
jgi:acetyl esterase/lipase